MLGRLGAGATVIALALKDISMMLADLIKATITFVMSNYSLSFFMLGLIVSLVAIARSGSSIDQPLVVEKLLAWYVFFSIGIDNFYNFVMHVFFGKMSAAFIGWADSPFQFEVGTASLGFAAVGLLAAFRSYDLRLAAVLGPSIFTLGAAVGHLHQMVTAHNFAPGNAGIIFWTDILIPLLGFVLLWLSRRAARPAAAQIAA
ncbi:MAG TPA: DUF6790 family protein [Bosea sp. (in: a-proteobacteria)]